LHAETEAYGLGEDGVGRPGTLLRLNPTSSRVARKSWNFNSGKRRPSPSPGTVGADQMIDRAVSEVNVVWTSRALWNGKTTSDVNVPEVVLLHKLKLVEVLNVTR